MGKVLLIALCIVLLNQAVRALLMLHVRLLVWEFFWLSVELFFT